MCAEILIYIKWKKALTNDTFCAYNHIEKVFLDFYAFSYYTVQFYIVEPIVKCEMLQSVWNHCDGGKLFCEKSNIRQ